MKPNKKDLDVIPIGDLALHDNYIPSLEAGSYEIRVQHRLSIDGSEQTDLNQGFVVTAPQFSIDYSQVINRYPPLGSAGDFGDIFPHIVLKDPILPWERAMNGQQGSFQIPWLALLTFAEGELIGGSPEDQSTSIAITDFLNMAKPTLVPQPHVQPGVIETDACRYILLPAALFKKIAPTLPELPYLSHVRRINTGNRPILGLNEDGLFSVVASNRMVTAPDPDKDQPVKNIVHLVSLEGMEPHLSDLNALDPSYASVALVTLASWTFLSIPEGGKDFYSLAEHLFQEESAQGGRVDPSALWLRLPPPAQGNGTIATEASKRIADGYLPLPYYTRSGEHTFAWHRGPLVPIQTPLPDGSRHYYSADSALIFNKNFGTFDTTLATAWETGREIALADAGFQEKLWTIRTKAAQAAEKLFVQNNSPYLRSALTHTMPTIPDAQTHFGAVLAPLLLKRKTGILPPKAPTDQPASIQRKWNRLEPFQAFLQTPEISAQINAQLEDDTDPLATWRANFCTLTSIPFDKLVPDERLLPMESIRFFYLDWNWIEAALDGAMSLGQESSKVQNIDACVRPLLHRSTLQALTGRASQKTSTTDYPLTSGMLLRSAMVSHWPNLSIRGRDDNDKTLKILRITHLSPNTLLCLFDGVPDNIELRQPQEGLGFGLDDIGKLLLRCTDSQVKPLGTEWTRIPIRDMNGQQQLCMREPGGTVLNIDPTDDKGLIRTLEASLQQYQPGSASITPATLALQLIKAQEAILFTSQTT